MSELAVAVRENGVVQTRLVHKHCVGHAFPLEALEKKGVLWEAFQQGEAVAFAPIDYGLVVIDFDTKWMGGFNGYSRLDRYYVSLEDKDQRAFLKQVFSQNRILGSASDEKLPPAKGSFPKWVSAVKKAIGGYALAKLFIAPPPGWVCQDFGRMYSDSEAWGNLFLELSEKGFDMNDTALWLDFLHQKEEDQPGAFTFFQKRLLGKKTVAAPAKMKTGPRL